MLDGRAQEVNAEAIELPSSVDPDEGTRPDTPSSAPPTSVIRGVALSASTRMSAILASVESSSSGSARSPNGSARECRTRLVRSGG
jgi:hypothetical protein